MPLYVTLAKFSEQGLEHVAGTVERGETWEDHAKKFGAKVREFLWTQGAYDMITIIEAPDEGAVMALVLAALKLGNVKDCQTLRGFTASEMKGILAKLG